MPDDPLAHSTEDLAGIDRLIDYRRCDVVEEYTFKAKYLELKPKYEP